VGSNNGFATGKRENFSSEIAVLCKKKVIRSNFSTVGFECRLDSFEKRLFVLFEIDVVVSDSYDVSDKNLELFVIQFPFVYKSVIVASAVADNYPSVYDLKLKVISRNIPFIKDKIVFRASSYCNQITVELKNIKFVSVVFDYEFQHRHSNL
jgi:hypothetical protein